MVGLRRGDIFWCDLEPTRGHEQGKLRPVVVISVDAYNASRSPMVAILPLTTASSKNPVHVELGPAETGMNSAATALTDQSRFIDRSRLRERAGRLSSTGQARIDRNLARVLGLLNMAPPRDAS